MISAFLLQNHFVVVYIGYAFAPSAVATVFLLLVHVVI